MVHKIKTKKGEIIGVNDFGTMVQILVKTKEGVDTVSFDWRPFMNFYEGVTGRDFYEDRGKPIVEKTLKGRKIEFKEGFISFVY